MTAALLLLLSAGPYATTPIGDELVIGGERHRLEYFTTHDSIDVVARWFGAGWEADGYPVSVDGDAREQLVVSAFETRKGLVRSVVLSTHAGKTLGITVLKDLWLKVLVVDGLAPLEGAVLSSSLSTADSQHRAAALPSALDAAACARARAWQALGYALKADARMRRGDRVAQRVLELSKGRARVVITLVEIDPTTTAIDETWVGR